MTEKMTDPMREKLALFGLNDKEQNFYLAALQLGAASVTEVAARAGVSRTNGYDLVERLERRGLLAQVGEAAGVRKVVPEDPSVLIRDWERSRLVLDELVPELRSIYNDSRTSKPRTRLYEGREGINRALWETLDCHSKVLLGVLSMHELLETPGQQWMAGFIAERVRRGIELRVVRSRSRETEAIWPSAHEEMRELRYAPEDLDLGMTMYINDDTVTYVSSKEENYAMVIESRELARLNRAFFQSLWLASSPPERMAGPR
ncbi:TrmB family transcriptional regulator [Achromobacter aloeverae]|uniref:Transcriptional regulator TrmB n=1 Tax=Achromobacter aloeverae TaxID=1750518 RepID=A0A4Q1HHV3_9BURK|nr:helix-turn-helix domain-containing protein [Achromobacter aloeverae]RXN85406.1 transcriptional regulator TrmB [Achromobacter aloeverae]